MEAHLIQIACSPAPEGHARWTIRLLEEKAHIKLETPVSRETIWRVLKNELRPHLNDYWCIPSKEDAEFITYMEDILDIYELPYNPMRPVVYMDEKPLRWSSFFVTLIGKNFISNYICVLFSNGVIYPFDECGRT